MKRMRRAAALLLCGLISMALCVPAAATRLPAAAAGDSTLYVGRVTGIVRNAEGGAARLTITSEAGSVYYTLVIAPSTLWVDAGGRKAGSGDGLKEGELIYAACPAQAAPAAGSTYTAAALLTPAVVIRGVGDDEDLAHYHLVSDFAPEKDGSWVITVDQGGLLLSADGDTRCTDYATGETLSLSALEVGDRVMVWYQQVMETFPVQARAACLLRLPGEQTALPEEGAALTVKLGETVSGEIEGRYESGVAMVPVAAVAKAIGLSASYVKGEEGRVVTLESETFSVMLAIDQGLISGATRIEGALGATGPLDYGRSAYIEDPGVTWAPAAVFTMLGQAVELEGTQLTIRAI